MGEPSIEAKVAVLEALHKELCKDVHEMRVNHLPHIERKLDGLILGMVGVLCSALIALARVLL